jgi:arabinose-5-phosphate isomerase
MVLLEARGITREDFARYHPSGSLGRSLLLRVSDVMRGRDQMALVHPSMSVREVLAEMSRRKAGAALAIDDLGRLEGIFTHGDFARCYQADANVGQKPVGPLLTLSPVSVDAQRLAAEVLRILETHRVDEVVVLDSERRPVGVVDSQDLARWRLI